MTKNKYLLAVSGGVDSCSLYHLLKKHNVDFMVVHINHHTRASANSLEQQLVEQMGADDQRQVIVADFYYNPHQKPYNFHAQARNFRLKTYQWIVKHYHLKGVILAHHLDDNWETIMMNKNAILPRMLLPKTIGKDGLIIYRPLLDWSKENIINYALNNGIIWYEDSSNASDKYLRNFYRHHYQVSEAQKRALIMENKARFMLYYDYQCCGFDYHTLRKSSDQALYLYAQLTKAGLNHISHRQVRMIIQGLDGCGVKCFNLDAKHKLYQIYNQLVINPRFPKPSGNVIRIKSTRVFNGYRLSFDSPTLVTDLTNPNLASVKHQLRRQMIKLKIPQPLRQSWPIMVIDEKYEIIKPSQIK